MTVTTHQREQAEINMTPMIDVLLVLIIIFMVITPVTSSGLETALPQPAPPTALARESHEIVVTVLAGGTVLLNQEELNLSALAPRLKQLYWNHPSQPMFVKGERGLEFGNVAAVIDLARGAGVERVGLMTN